MWNFYNSSLPHKTPSKYYFDTHFCKVGTSRFHALVSDTWASAEVPANIVCDPCVDQGYRSMKRWKSISDTSDSWWTMGHQEP